MEKKNAGKSSLRKARLVTSNDSSKSRKMAMQKLYTIRDIHSRSTTAVGYHFARREIFVGCEDGVLKTFEAESGTLVNVFNAHAGWITNFTYWNEPKLMLSSSNDGNIIAWGSGGSISDTIALGVPVHCMTINVRRHQLVCGVYGGIRVYALDAERSSSHVINRKLLYFAKEHSDIVKCIACLDSRIYSVGFDRRLIIYDSSYTGDSSLVPLFNNVVHDAGITCLLLVKDDNDNNVWILTGSFDKTVKVWSMDGKLVRRIDNFYGTITSMCYVRRTNLVWVADGSYDACLIDVNSGDNVSGFVDTFQQTDEEKCRLHVLHSITELGQLVIASKIPILFLAGDHDGVISKWERAQSNHFVYRMEAQGGCVNLNTENSHPEKVSMYRHSNTTLLKMVFIEDLDYIVAASEDNSIYVWSYDRKTVRALQNMRPDNFDSLLTIYSVLLDPESTLLSNNMSDQIGHDSVTNRVAGFVCQAVLCEHFSCVSSLVAVGDDQGQQNAIYILSGGWDRRVCLWDIRKAKLKYVCRTSDDNASAAEIMCDGIITDMAFSPQNREFAYSSSDKMTYVRKLNTSAGHAPLMAVLQGHDGEVTCVQWNIVCCNWVTGSDDGTIRIWSGIRLNDCIQVLQVDNNKAVSCIAIDQTTGAIVVSSHNIIRVFETAMYHLVQTHIGHADSVRSVIHVPERSQYVSCSWDGTIRVWNAWKRSSDNVVCCQADSRCHLDNDARSLLRDLQRYTGKRALLSPTDV